MPNYNFLLQLGWKYHKIDGQLQIVVTIYPAATMTGGILLSTSVPRDEMIAISLKEGPNGDTTRPLTADIDLDVIDAGMTDPALVRSVIGLLHSVMVVTTFYDANLRPASESVNNTTQNSEIEIID